VLETELIDGDAESIAEEMKTAMYRKTTVGELGMRLPIGTGPLDGSRARVTDLETRLWTAAEEERIGALRKKNSRMTEAELVLEVLALFCTRWGEHDFSAMPHNDRVTILKAQTTADIFHAWTMLRIENMGEKLKFDVKCPDCEHKYAFELNAEDFVCHVPVSENTNLLAETPQLSMGMTIGAERRRVLLVKPAPWGLTLEVEKSSGGLSTIKIRIVKCSVAGWPGSANDVAISLPMVNTLIKRDFEDLVRYIHKAHEPVDLSYTTQCPGCEVEHLQQVPWYYDIFFSVAG
jgi:hypothetical protein